MTENQRSEKEVNSSTKLAKDNTVIVRIPKPNLQIIVLGLIALITVFQSFQLIRISSKASSAPVKTAGSAITNTTTNGSSGTGSNANVPQSMVGGC